MLKDPVTLIGIGEIGAVLARGLLRCGHPVFPITREMSIDEAARAMPEPAAVVIAVGESALDSVLAALPEHWRGRAVLLQNELLPRDWQRHGLTDPTVLSVWFEKKRGMDVKILMPCPIHGPHAGLIARALEALDIPVRRVDTPEAMERELVVKNLYILTTNIAGLVVGGDVQTLWADHQALAQDVLRDVIALQEHLTGHRHNEAELIAGLLDGFQGDPCHPCMGRSAPARLARALAQADAAGLPVPTLRRIATNIPQG
ncbi:MAG: hypothetical protein PHI49_08495 [Halothiobacillaceae bacterium]|jgi:hypothetical protein|nr:hypothetical protein [Halothiobacillaceae bacterium]MDY0049624.1 hypothetical protein [Halothiobacillaceae bacterium]